jgi:hypothetical protein
VTRQESGGRLVRDVGEQAATNVHAHETGGVERERWRERQQGDVGTWKLRRQQDWSRSECRRRAEPVKATSTFTDGDRLAATGRRGREGRRGMERRRQSKGKLDGPAAVRAFDRSALRHNSFSSYVASAICPAIRTSTASLACVRTMKRQRGVATQRPRFTLNMSKVPQIRATRTHVCPCAAHRSQISRGAAARPTDARQHGLGSSDIYLRFYARACARTLSRCPGSACGGEIARGPNARLHGFPLVFVHSVSEGKCHGNRSPITG